MTSRGGICVLVVAYAQIAGWFTDDARHPERPPDSREPAFSHIRVVYDQYEVPPGKDYTCAAPLAGNPCGRYGCLGAAATPQRIWEDLRDSGLVMSLEEAAARDLTYEERYAEFDSAEPFGWAGHLAGRAVSSWIGTRDPAHTVLFLPRTLVHSPPDTAGSRYSRALEKYVRRETFSTAKRVPWTFLPTEDTFGSDPRPLPELD